MANGTCSVGDCATTGLLRRGWCAKHYERWRSHGDPSLTAWGKPLRWLESAVADPTDECQEWPFARHGRSGEYGEMRFLGVTTPATHVALITTGQPRPDPPNDFALHSCDNPPCVNPRHLRWGSRQENADDMLERNRAARGEKIQNSKLTVPEVLEIRTLRIKGLTLQGIAERYGVTKSTVGKIVRREGWTHV